MAFFFKLDYIIKIDVTNLDILTNVCEIISSSSFDLRNKTYVPTFYRRIKYKYEFGYV